MKILLCYIHLFLGINLLVKAQTLKEIHLTKCISTFPFKNSYVGTTLIDKLVDYKVPEGYKDFIIKSYSIKNNSGKTDFKLLGDTKRNYVSFLININTDSSRTVVCDANNNLDFSDDKIIIFPKDKPKLPLTDFFVIPFIYQNRLINYHIQIETYSSALKYTNQNEQSHYLVVKPFETYSGFINISEVNYRIFIRNNIPKPYFTLKEFEIYIDKSDVFEHHNDNEIIVIDGSKILLDSISITGETLYVKIYNTGSKFKEYGFSKDFYLKNLSLKDIGKKEVAIPSSKKYTLLDFWGTWCAPCKELTPQLVEANKRFNDKLTLISLANLSKSDDVKIYTSKNKMVWHQIVSDEINKKIFDKDMFYVNSYPTFILIDSTGKILFRNTAKEGLEEIVRFLDTH